MTQVVSTKVLWDAYWADPSDENRNALAERYWPWVRHVSRRVKGELVPAIDADDLVSEGTLGLLESIPRFDPASKAKFTSFAYFRVRGAMLDGLRAMDWVPRIVRQRAAKLSWAAERFEIKHGRPPKDWELARALHIKKAALAAIQREVAPVTVRSLNSRWWHLGRNSHGKTVEAMEVLAEECHNSPSRRMDRREWLAHMLRGLNQRERMIVVAYCYDGQTLKDIGKALGLSESRVSQMLTDIKARFRVSRNRSDFNDTGLRGACLTKGTIPCQPLPNVRSRYPRHQHNRSRKPTG